MFIYFEKNVFLSDLKRKVQNEIKKNEEKDKKGTQSQMNNNQKMSKRDDSISVHQLRRVESIIDAGTMEVFSTVISFNGIESIESQVKWAIRWI